MSENFIQDLLKLKRNGAISQQEAQRLLDQWSLAGADIFNAVTPEDRDKKLETFRDVSDVHKQAFGDE